MKITCECLVVKNAETGELEPLVLDFPDGKIRELHNLRVRAYESGLRMKKALTSYVGEGLGDGGGKFNIDIEAMKKEIYEAGVNDREMLLATANDPLNLFTEQLIGKLTGTRLSKEDFQEVWDKTLGPAIESGDVTWECSERLAAHLIKVGNGELSDDEIIRLIDNGEM